MAPAAWQPLRRRPPPSPGASPFPRWQLVHNPSLHARAQASSRPGPSRSIGSPPPSLPPVSSRVRRTLRLYICPLFFSRACSPSLSLCIAFSDLSKARRLGYSHCNVGGVVFFCGGGGAWISYASLKFGVFPCGRDIWSFSFLARVLMLGIGGRRWGCWDAFFHVSVGALW